MIEVTQGFIYDYRQLGYLHISPDRVPFSGTIVDEPYWKKYKYLFILLHPSIPMSLIVSVVWLIRANRRESRRRIQTRTRLLVQNKLAEQCSEFDNVFHSIRDGMIMYDTDLHIHFTNRSLLRMLRLPHESGGHLCEGTVVGSIFEIRYNDQDILHSMLEQVTAKGENAKIPQGAFMKEVHSDKYLPVSEGTVLIRSKGTVTDMVLSTRNISNEEVQKRFFDMIVDESSIYSWQFNMEANRFIFPQGFLGCPGYDESVTTVSHDEVNCTIYSDDSKEISPLFNRALTGKDPNTRLNLCRWNASGEYEWWEYRFSVTMGLTQDSSYDILGVRQGTQRYKAVERGMRGARDKAFQADGLKSAFPANTSHETRIPLNTIVGFSDLLSDTSGFTSEEVAQFTGTINKNYGLLLALTNNILDLPHIGSGTMESMFAEYSLPLLLKTVHDFQRSNMPPEVELVLCMPESDKKYLTTDNVCSQQAMNNLIGNAAKSTSNGFITFGYEDDEVPDYTRILVEDTGASISEEGIRHVLERFYRVGSSTQGAGLGLSICQTIIERLNGITSVTSEVGKSTRFTVRLPGYCE